MVSAPTLARLARACSPNPGKDEPVLGSATLSDIGIATEDDARAFVEAVRSSLGIITLCVEDCLENPTIAELAALIDAKVQAPTKKPRGSSPARSKKFMPLGLAAMAILVAPTAAFDGLGFQLDANGCVVNYDPSVDYYPAARRAMFVKDDVGFVNTATGYAKHFDIVYHKTFKIVRNLAEIEKGNNGTYVLHHCGTPISSITGLPADAVHAPKFEVPIPTVSTDTTIGLAFMEALQLFDKLDVADMTYVSSPCLQELHKCGDTAHAAPGWSAVPSDEYIDQIKVSSKLHVVSSDKAHFDFDIAFAASGDPSLLGRVEWLKYLSAFFNAEPFANRLFRKIERDLYATQSQVAEAQKAGAKPPVVAFVSYSNKSSWQPEEQWTILRPEYKLEAILKAGGRPLSMSLMPDSDFFGSYYNTYDRITSSSAAIKKLLEGVDVVIDETYVYDNLGYNLDTFLAGFGLTGADAATYPFLANDLVLRLDATLGQVFSAQGNDWYEQGVLRPDFFVEELASHSFPAHVAPPVHTTKFLRNLALGEVPRLVDDSHSVDPHCVCDGDTKPAAAAPVYNDCVDNVCIIQDLSTLPNPPAPPPSPSPPPSPTPLAPLTTDDDKEELAGWAVGVIIAVAALALLLAVGICFLVSREKKGTPIFSSVVVKNQVSA